ncbi:hypothetical protein J32TS2_07490 [Shouchella clausii]|uniref:glycosyltransferase family 4 protein n=1 Tax=Shouchella TaxID=2893057 RepID=UPI0007C4B582|nr:MULTISPECIES: glycosyltransferase family 4 protein [Shouchella]MCM3379521.1 glycosyltransferase family 4 protein [Shouchella rhizosphaerae]PAD47644.1 hypothetical protein CHI09_05555 [Shouchella clausii]PAE81944.1 hypothetical protein CHH77_12855 [Shouchella clausii]PAF09031.1 hypothetical protein CHH65_13450 [Shouchella clausii]GIN15393.1 hypothetical protein J32TS2_07490 [Shouchella clausii]
MDILLVAGGPGWAFDYRAKDLLSLQYEKINLHLKYVNQVKAGDRSRYDLFYPMSVNIARKLHKLTTIPYDQMATGMTSIRILDNHMKNDGDKKAFIQFLKKFRGLNTGSDEIATLLRSLVPIKKTRVGINEKQFKPPVPKKQNDRFKVGWVGRIDQQDYRELKGYDIVTAGLEKLDVELDIRTYQDRVPREKMVDFYQQLDCFICSSSSEHIPLPVLEAAACGVPIISTRVGIVPELIKNNTNGFIVPREANAFQKGVKILMDNTAKREQFSKAIRKTVVNHWTLERCKKEWETFFLSLKE